jgi:hypothetical protein
MLPGRLFDAKFMCGALYMLAVTVLQVLVLITAGYVLGFEGEVPIEKLFYYLLFTTAANFAILLLQQVLSLLFANQMLSLSVGLIGGLAGLFIMFFPQNLERLLLWGYYGVLMLVRHGLGRGDANYKLLLGSGRLAGIYRTGGHVLCDIYHRPRPFVRKEM